MATVVYDCIDFCYSAKDNGIDEEEARKFYWKNVRAQYECNTHPYDLYDLKKGEYEGAYPKWAIKTLIDMCVDDDSDTVTFGRE